MGMNTGKLTALLATTSIALALGATVARADTIQVDKGGDIAALCGEKPTRVALVDGYGGDPQQYASLINGYTAQGHDIILGFTDFGDAALPAYRAAHEAGVTMVPYFGKISGEPGSDYAVNPYQDSIAIGAQFADWTGKALGGKGNVLMLGGPAGLPRRRIS